VSLSRNCTDTDIIAIADRLSGFVMVPALKLHNNFIYLFYDY
jgi:hypothetical protein